jgi:hypothetical protein
MASEALKRTPELSRGDIISFVLGESNVQMISIPEKADLKPVDSAFAALKKQGASRATWDAALVEPVHSSLKHLPRHLHLDPTFWQYLTTERLRDFVWQRFWDGSPPSDVAEALEQPTKWRRFECRRTMNAMSRNAVARLFWAGDLLSVASDYSLARDAFMKQEIQQQVFDRLFGLHPDAARAFVRKSNGLKGRDIQKLGERLNEYASTIAVEFLNDKEIEKLLV